MNTSDATHVNDYRQAITTGDLVYGDFHRDETGPPGHGKRQVLREEVREALISAILTREFQPGDRIVESGVARALGVSQTTIRETLREIEQCGTISP